MLKNLVVYSTCLSVIGCQTIENPLDNVSSVSSNAISSSGCGEKPMVSLSEKDVEEVVLNESTVTKSGQVSANKNVGYTFIIQMRMFVFGYLLQIMQFSKVESYPEMVNILFKLLHLKG
jgi:hypothetical protein